MNWFQGRGVNSPGPGKVRLVVVLFLLLAGAGVYLAIKFIPPYWTYLSMQDPVKETTMAIIASTDEARAREELIRRANEEGLALDAENIEIAREYGMLVVRVRWVAPVDLPGYRYDLRFQIEERAPLR